MDLMSTIKYQAVYFSISTRAILRLNECFYFAKITSALLGKTRFAVVLLYLNLYAPSQLIFWFTISTLEVTRRTWRALTYASHAHRTWWPSQNIPLEQDGWIRVNVLASPRRAGRWVSGETWRHGDTFELPGSKSIKVCILTAQVAGW